MMTGPAHPERPSQDDRALSPVTVVTAIAVLVALLAVGSFAPSPSSPSLPAPLAMVDESSKLGPVFHPGVILAGGSNSTASLLGGIGEYSQPTGVSLPVFSSLTREPGGITVTNRTSEISNYFDEGGIYAIGWNGSAWLIGGQRSPGGSDNAALVELRDGRFTDLTSRFASYFVGGGVWSVGWNESGWLIAGNSSTGPTLLSWDGGPIVDLSPEVTAHSPSPWVQLLVWNGLEWLVGGQGVFGLLTGSAYHDLDPGSPFEHTGEFAAAWSGSFWVVGGTGARVVVVTGTTVGPGPALPVAFDRFALFIVFIGSGWLIGGRGTSWSGAYAPELLYWNGGPGPRSLTDLSSYLPASFSGGEIQGGVPAPEFGASSWLLVGEGSYNPTSGYGVGAMALATAAPT